MRESEKILPISYVMLALMISYIFAETGSSTYLVLRESSNTAGVTLR